MGSEHSTASDLPSHFRVPCCLQAQIQLAAWATATPDIKLAAPQDGQTEPHVPQTTVPGRQGAPGQSRPGLHMWESN